MYGHTLIEYLGNGYKGTVFRAHNAKGSEVALKLFYSDPVNKPHIPRLIEREFKSLKAAEGIQGIPQARGQYIGPHTLDQTPLLRYGELSQMVELYYTNKPTDFWIVGAIAMDLIPDAQQIGIFHKQPSEFYDDVERIAQELWERELIIPPDSDIFESQGKPYILDWDQGLFAPDKELVEINKRYYAEAIPYMRERWGL